MRLYLRGSVLPEQPAAGSRGRAGAGAGALTPFVEEHDVIVTAQASARIPKNSFFILVII